MREEGQDVGCRMDGVYRTFSISVMINPRQPNIHKTAIPRRQKQAQAWEGGCDEVAVHFELGHDFGQTVREGQIPDVDMAQGNQAGDSDRHDEKAQRESRDDEGLGLGSHVQVPDEVYGHRGDDEVCQDAHDACCDPAGEDGREGLLAGVVEPWCCGVGTECDAEEGYYAEG